MKKILTKEFIIGISVIIAIAILIIGIEYLKGVNIFKPANFYIAKYENVEGLETAAPVRIDGFKVGQVREINFNYENPDKIEVVLALNKSLRLPVDSKAIIGSSFLSGAYIDIIVGKSKELIEIGGEVETGSNPDLLSSISEDIMPSVGGVIERIDSLLVSLNGLVADPALVASVKNLEKITDKINSASGSLDVVMSKGVPSLLAKVDNVAVNIDTITSDLSLLSAQLKMLPISNTMENVNDMSKNLLKFSNQLNDPNSSLGLLMNDPELYDRLNRVAADVDSLIVDIKKNPKRYISIKLL